MCEIDSKSNKKNKDLIKKFKNIQGQKRRSKNLPSANCWKSPKKRKQWM